jgi:hypothetical protein
MRPLQIKKPGNNKEAWKWLAGRIIGYENPVAYKAASKVYFSLHDAFSLRALAVNRFALIRDIRIQDE